MDGKRFGVGLAAGILVGLVVITASGGLGAGLVEFGPVGSLNNAAAVVTTTSPGSTVTTTASTQSTNGSTLLAIVQSNSSKTLATMSTTSTSNSTVSTTPPNQLADLYATVASAPSSRLSNLAAQPILANAVISIPVVVAFVLGALLYRASVRGRAEPSEEPQSPSA